MPRLEIDYLNEFRKEFKKLSKKNKNLQSDFDYLIDEILENPTIGESMGKGIYKIRLKRQNKGKRGGYRVITYYLNKENTLYLTDIFSKNIKDNVLRNEIEKRLQSYGLMD